MKSFLAVIYVSLFVLVGCGEHEDPLSSEAVDEKKLTDETISEEDLSFMFARAIPNIAHKLHADRIIILQRRHGWIVTSVLNEKGGQREYGAVIFPTNTLSDRVDLARPGSHGQMARLTIEQELSGLWLGERRLKDGDYTIFTFKRPLPEEEEWAKKAIEEMRKPLISDY